VRTTNRNNRSISILEPVGTNNYFSLAGRMLAPGDEKLCSIKVLTISLIACFKSSVRDYAHSMEDAFLGKDLSLSKVSGVIFKDAHPL
jgi:hypothetical protein